MATINLRTNPVLKKSANQVLSAMGLDMSSAVNLFLHQVVITKTIPFPIRTPNGFTLEEEEGMIHEIEVTKKALKSGKLKPFKSVKAMMNDLMK